MFRSLAGLLRPAVSVQQTSRCYSEKLLIWNDQSVSDMYLQTRPPYPPRLAPWALDYYFSMYPKPDRIPLIVDVGCGSGQMTTLLAKHADRVLGFDGAESQILLARKHASRPNIEYQVSAAESLSDHVDHGKTDLMTVGTAFHYFDRERFYEEVHKCLKPKGVLALLGFYICGFVNEHDQHDDVCMDYIEMQLGPKYKEAMHVIRECYQTVPFPFEDVQYKKDYFDVVWPKERVNEFFNSCRNQFQYPELQLMVPGIENDPKGTIKVRVFLCGLLGHI